MSFEERLESIDNTLKLLATLMQSGQALSPANVAAATDAAPEKKTRTKKADAVVETAAAEAVEAVEAKNDSPTQAAAEPSTAVAETPVVSTPTASTASVQASEVLWKDVLAKLLELNKSTAPGHGREGVLSVIAKFPGADGKPVDVVPKLESIGKHGEILAFVESLLAPAAVEEKPLF